MNSDPIVGTYPESASAHLALSKLNAEGIEGHIHRVSRYQAMAGHGYVLRVAAADSARASAILERYRGPVDLDEYVDTDDASYRRCPSCKSVMIQRGPYTVAQRLALVLTLGVASYVIVKDFRCTKCGQAWRDR